MTAGRNSADQNAIADLISGQSFAEFFDHANRLVSDHQSRFHRVFAAQYVQVRPADGGERNSDYSFIDAGARLWHFFNTNVVWSVKNVGSHFSHCVILLVRQEL